MRDYPSDTIDLLIGELGSPDNDIQLRAESGLIKLGKSAVYALIAVTGHPNAQVRWRAAYALGEIGDPRAFESIAALLHDTQEEVRDEAVEALGNLGDLRAIESLADVIRNANEDEVRAIHASHYMAMFGSAATQALGDLLLNGNAAARKVAAYALGNAGDPSATGALRTALADPEVRHDAAVSLGKLGDTAVIDVLIDYLRAGNEDIHDGDALWALKCLDGAAVQSLQKIFESSTGKVRRDAQWVLSRIGDRALS